MTDPAPTGDLDPVSGPWGRLTMIFQLTVLALAALSARNDAPGPWPLAPAVTLSATFIAGLVMLDNRDWRPVGARVLGATLAVAVVEVPLTLVIWLSTLPGNYM